MSENTTDLVKVDASDVIDDIDAEDASSPIRVVTVKRNDNYANRLLNFVSTNRDQSEELEKPLIPLDDLATLSEQSGILQPNVDAYTVNIHKTGYTFEPVIKLDDPDAALQVKEEIYTENLLAAEEVGASLESVKEPTDEEVERAMEELRRIARVQRARAEAFFESCYPDGDFTELRTKTCKDYEYLGGAYWEVLRGNDDVPRSLYFTPGYTIRIGKEKSTQDNSIPVIQKRKRTKLTHDSIQVRRTFKKFAQVDTSGMPAIWFKEFGDPRLMSNKTGKYYVDMDDMLKAEGKESEPATELFPFLQHALASPYGSPRWSGQMPGVLGSRELDETNFDYFLNDAIPALALLVAGGRFGPGTETKLKEYFEEEVRGRQGRHKLLVLEAESQRRGVTGPSANPKLEFVPLRSAQLQDALFQIYDERNKSKVDTAFRHPPSLMGDKDVDNNDLRFAEDQVYGPERDTFDGRVNKFLMPALRIWFWKFKSNDISPRDPKTVGDLALRSAKEGVLVPDEVREIMGRVLGYPVRKLNKVWSKQPLPFTVAALGVKAGPAEAVREQGRQAGNPAPDDALSEELGIGQGGELSQEALQTLQTLEALNKPGDTDEDET